MTYSITEHRKADCELQRCAVFKIDFKGRLVFIDDLAEQLLQLPAENLFGRHIKEFLTEESYTALMAFLKRSRHFETVFEAFDLIIVDVSGREHFLKAIISLNFIGGNPSNYQIILVPPSVAIQTAGESAGTDQLLVFLCELIAETNSNMDWGQLTEIFTIIPELLRIGIYRFDGETLHLLAASSPSGKNEPPVDMNVIDENHLKVVLHRQKFMGSTKDSAAALTEMMPQTAEICYPLIHGDRCWGIIRLFCSGDVAELDRMLRRPVAFLGQALFSFINQ